MNTIPTIFNERKVAHTVIGGAIRKSDEERSPLTVVLLNRGGRYYRSAVFQALENAGFSSVISVEISTEAYDIEGLSGRFPGVKFLVPLEQVTVGEMINTAMAETDSPFVLVLWNDVKLSPAGLGPRLFERVHEANQLCVCPVLLGPRLEPLPVQMTPALQGNSFLVEPMPCVKDNSPTVYPFDFMGIYGRERFVRLGGFDHTIKNPYWQNLDFGFRAHLWGERITIAGGFRLTYDAEAPAEDVTADASYERCYLKTLAPVYRRDAASLPLSRFLPWLPRSGMNPFDALSGFAAARRWVALNRYRFVRDARDLTSDWEPMVQ